MTGQREREIHTRSEAVGWKNRDKKAIIQKAVGIYEKRG